MAQSNNSQIRLNKSDWDSLFPGQEFQIASTTLTIVPLSLKGIATITSKLSKLATIVSTMSITLEDVDNRNIEVLTTLVQLITEEAPEILSIMSGLHQEDVQKLPLSVAVELFSKCLDVNIESQEDLVKNFKALGEKFNQFLGQTPTTNDPQKLPQG